MTPGWRCDPGGPTWSPDGKQVAVGGVDGIYIVDLADPLNPTNITPAAPDHYDQPAWSPDGKQIAVRVPARGAVGVIPATGGPAELLTDGSVAPFQPNWSPDGLRIVFQMDVGTGRIGYYDRCTSTTGVLTGSFNSVFDPAWSPDGERIAYWGYYGPVAGSAWDVYSTAKAGGEPMNLTLTPYPIAESAPDWQPTGDATRSSACGRDLTVNSTSDRRDADSDDGRCDTGKRVDGKRECTLRAAITEANKARRPSRVTFATGDPTTPSPASCQPSRVEPSWTARRSLEAGWSSMATTPKGMDCGSLAPSRPYVASPSVAFPARVSSRGTGPSRGRREPHRDLARWPDCGAQQARHPRHRGRAFDHRRRRPLGSGLLGRLQPHLRQRQRGCGARRWLRAPRHRQSRRSRSRWHHGPPQRRGRRGRRDGGAGRGRHPVAGHVPWQRHRRQPAGPGGDLGDGSATRVEGNLIDLDITGRRAIAGDDVADSPFPYARGNGVFVIGMSLLDSERGFDVVVEGISNPDDVVIGGSSRASRNVIQGDLRRRQRGPR